MDAKELIAKRVGQEFNDGDLVNPRNRDSHYGGGSFA